ncbi:interleukin 12Ba isoform X1 [Mugil cephalus]|uniref:interleukin 12Ba isoform X1 n=1 Tax=Mugil cephalus TaxID=48193 RepID=UPI001FB5E62B|nr:interleukin 12Ba isoform X1 [Mugil cephalus]
MKDKMKLFVFFIVCAFLQVTYQNPLSHWTLLPNILVLEVDGTVGQFPLSCFESPEEIIRRDNQSQDIFWKKNGVDQTQSGNSYLVQLEESLGGGNYSCHGKDGSLLNHTVVLIRENQVERRKILLKTDGEDYLKCSAQNYSGEFHCSWTWHSSRVGRVAFIRAQRVSDDNHTQCSVDTSDLHWMCSSSHSNFSCSVDANSISCLDERHCPYAEESQQIHITVYVMTKHFLVESYSKHFYLSEIVKPDKVRIAKINATVIEWSYPSSWSSPYSYFPLTFQIAQLRRGCKRCGNPCTDSKALKSLTFHSTDICQFQVKHSAKAVCVRAKDALCNSQWSEWSHVRLRKKTKNKGKNKKQA